MILYTILNTKKQMLTMLISYNNKKVLFSFFHYDEGN